MTARPQPRKPSRKLTEADAAQIKKLLQQREIQSRIAAQFDVNGGRISEINTGKKFAEVPPAP
jgi:predicted XRE-type DNA-binding protein